MQCTLHHRPSNRTVSIQAALLNFYHECEICVASHVLIQHVDVAQYPAAQLFTHNGIGEKLTRQ